MTVSCFHATIFDHRNSISFAFLNGYQNFLRSFHRLSHLNLFFLSWLSHSLSPFGHSSLEQFHLFDLIWLVVDGNDPDDDDDDIIVRSIFGYKNRFHCSHSTVEGWNIVACIGQTVSWRIVCVGGKMSKITIKYPQWIRIFFSSLLSLI